jgi:hypothetical protein
MEFARLLLGVSLPWLAAWSWLAALEQRQFSWHPNRFRQVGYALFIGYAALQATVLATDRITGGVHYLPVIATFSLVTLAGLAAWRYGRSVGETPAIKRPSHLLTWLLIGWIAVHLIMVAIEILHRPVFPWDASLSWMYRAKAWFYAGTITPMDSPPQWLEGSGDSLYNVPGNHYPTLVPIVALWSALGLGQWSETLVNLPVLFCGVALVAGMFGQCREYGFPVWLSVVCAYLLLSIPLVGTHLSLAGQADIWMAGFTGLGFVALLHGVLRDDRYQLLLGLFMIAVGAATKVEGTIWFAAALLTLALVKRPMATVVLIITTAAVVLAGWLATGVTYLELPFVGGAGVAEDRLHIPLIGSYALQSFDLWTDYRDNFFLGGTWHLLWPLVLLTAASLLFLPAGRTRRTIAVFYGVILCAQLFIFQATESGYWAEDWTAINRLPLHFAPPVVFSLAIVAWEHLRTEGNRATGATLLGIPALGLLIVVLLGLGYLLIGNSSTPAERLTLKGSDTGIVVGGGRLAGNIGVIDSFSNNTAIVSSGPISLDTRGLQLLRLRAEGSRDGHVSFFWRNGPAPEDLHTTEIYGNGIQWANLGDRAEWSGRVTEIGLVFYADGDKPAEFHFLDLYPSSLPLQLAKLAHDWSRLTVWSQRSAHWIAAGARDTRVPLPVLLAGWVVVTALLVAALRWRGRRCYPALLACALIAWGLLDLRWTVNRLAQAATTMSEYPVVSATYLEFGDDQIIRDLVSEARPVIENPDKRTVVMAESGDMRFQLQRAKYHALPARAYFHEGTLNNLPTHIADYVLVLRQRYPRPGQRPATAAGYADELSQRPGVGARPLWDTPEGFLIAVERKHQPGTGQGG